MVLPLHVFEPRYRQLFRQLMDEAPEDRTFGVVRVTAGSEGGGGGAHGRDQAADGLDVDVVEQCGAGRGAGRCSHVMSLGVGARQHAAAQ
ncbi:MAG: hypothetical protein ACO3UW_05190 [Candidatus Nanopelagicales bacterium]